MPEYPVRRSLPPDKGEARGARWGFHEKNSIFRKKNFMSGPRESYPLMKGEKTVPVDAQPFRLSAPAGQGNQRVKGGGKHNHSFLHRSNGITEKAECTMIIIY